MANGVAATPLPVLSLEAASALHAKAAHEAALGSQRRVERGLAATRDGNTGHQTLPGAPAMSGTIPGAEHVGSAGSGPYTQVALALQAQPAARSHAPVPTASSAPGPSPSCAAVSPPMQGRRLEARQPLAASQPQVIAAPLTAQPLAAGPEGPRLPASACAQPPMALRAPPVYVASPQVLPLPSSAPLERHEAPPIVETLQPSQFAPTRPASPSMTAAGPRLQSNEPLGLGQEVAAKEVELHVLRAEVEAKELEVFQLRDKVRDAELRLLEASGTVGTLSAKVEATAGNRHAVLEASARQMDSQVATLRRRLARMEWELAEKDEEISTLRQATQAGAKRIDQQQGQLDDLQRSHVHQDQEVVALTQDAGRLQRQQVVDEWREHVQAQIQQDTADSQLARERERKLEQFNTLEEEMSALRAFMSRMEEKCKNHAAEIARQRQQHDALVMEEHLCVSAARLGHETADEQKKSQIAEHRVLEARIREELSRKSKQVPRALAYDAVEAGMTKDQSELLALTACMREISRTLQDPGFVGFGDALDVALDAFIKSQSDAGETLALVRVSPNEVLINNSVVRCELSEGGRLCVRMPRGGLAPIGDFVQQRNQHGGDALAKPPVVRPSPSSPSPPQRLPVQAPQAGWGIPALVTPMAIGQTESLLVI